MPLFAADEDDSAFDIVGGVHNGYAVFDQFTRLSRDLTRHRRAVSKWTSSRRLSLFSDELGIEG